MNNSIIRWDRSICKCVTRKRGKHGHNSKKMTSVIYTELYDGVHPSLELSNKWCNYTCSSVYHDIMKSTIFLEPLFKKYYLRNSNVVKMADMLYLCHIELLEMYHFF